MATAEAHSSVDKRLLCGHGPVALDANRVNRGLFEGLCSSYALFVGLPIRRELHPLSAAADNGVLGNINRMDGMWQWIRHPMTSTEQKLPSTSKYRIFENPHICCGGRAWCSRWFSDWFRVCGEVTAVTPAGIEGRPLLTYSAARVLPNLPLMIPMESTFRQKVGDRRRLLLREGNPDPLPNHFGNLEEPGRFRAEKEKHSLGIQCAICPAKVEINLSPPVKAQMFGSAQEPVFFILFCGGFHGLFWCSTVRLILSPLTKKTAQQGGQRE
jgi:hypothetical protein